MQTIWTDKFGSTFVVHCQDAQSGKDALEYWIPPKKFALCEAGQFDRAVRVSVDFEGLYLYTITITAEWFV